jgi:nucleoside-diphosphate-sugar epimerase
MERRIIVHVVHCKACTVTTNYLMRALIVGCGYVGLRLGTMLAAAGHEVTGIRRTHTQEADMREGGIKMLLADISQPGSLFKLPSAFDWVVNCVSSSRGGVEDYQATYVNGMRHLVEWLKPQPPKKFVYTSSTSVYGQTDGSIVTETDATQPVAETAKTLLAAENVLLGTVPRFPTVILRVAGIYGPDRGYWFRRYLAGEAVIEGDGRRILNMIHVDDVAGAVISALKQGEPGQIYNVVDDEPVTQFEFFQWLSEKTGRGLPPSVAEGVPTNRKREITNKRISNLKLKARLGYQLKYPTFRQGYGQELLTLK